MQYDYSAKQLWVSLFISQQTEGRQEQRGWEVFWKQKEEKKNEKQ